MKKLSSLLLGFIFSFGLYISPSFAGDKGTLYSNEAGTKYCCCSGTDDCSSPACSGSTCDDDGGGEQ